MKWPLLVLFPNNFLLKINLPLSAAGKFYFEDTVFKIKFTLTNSLIVISVSCLFDPGLEARWVSQERGSTGFDIDMNRATVRVSPYLLPAFHCIECQESWVSGCSFKYSEDDIYICHWCICFLYNVHTIDNTYTIYALIFDTFELLLSMGSHGCNSILQCLVVFTCDRLRVLLVFPPPCASHSSKDPCWYKLLDQQSNALRCRISFTIQWFKSQGFCKSFNLSPGITQKQSNGRLGSLH